MMELGATVCTPREPDCPNCPIRTHCAARVAGVVDRHPPAKQRRSTEKIHLTMIVQRDRRGRVLLERGVFRFLPDMWLPLVCGEPEAEHRDDDVVEVTHAITHRSFRIRIVRRRAITPTGLEIGVGGERRWFTEQALAAIPRSSLLDKALAVA
jgi:A/G-specific adenine glycosylase